jgi:hypothetical protein
MAAKAPSLYHCPCCGTRFVHAAGYILLTIYPVGASQVTAIVQQSAQAEREKACSYQVAFRAQLVPPYLVSLRAPVPLVSPEVGCCWPDIVRKTWDGKRQRAAAV